MTDVIPLTDVSWQHLQVWDEIHSHFDALLLDPTCDGTQMTHNLELAFEEHFGAPWIAVATQSGLAAQTLLLRSLGIGGGDEVITAPNSDLATTSAISHAGARFVLADIEPGTFNLDPAAVEAAITTRTKAILPVHMYGHPARVDALRELAEKHNLLLLEDATLALGASLNGARLGTFGAGAFFSFAPRKILGGIGNGGMVILRDSTAAENIRRLRGYGLEPEIQNLPMQSRHMRGGLFHVVEGYNLKLDGIHAAITHAKFRNVDAWADLRRSAAARYDEGLAGVAEVITPAAAEGSLPAWRNYTILSEQRDALRSHLAEQQITTATLYSPPVHLQPVYLARGYAPGDFPVAEAQAPRLICLPIYPGIDTQQIDRVIEQIRVFFGGS